MGVSFKISKRGYKPKPLISELTHLNDATHNSLEIPKVPSNNITNGNDEDAVGLTGSSMSSGKDYVSGEDEASFILNLYPDGYSIVKASEIDNGNHAAFQDGLKLLRPYDRTSENLFAAIECGRLPGGILGDIPCKFVDGSVTCEIRDYRKCTSQPGSNISSLSESTTISKVCLKMSLENVVKDIPLMADDSWTYGDLMEVESRILNALQPKLCLDPVPRLDRLSKNQSSLKINLGLAGMRKRRLRQIPEVTVTSSNRPHGKKICIDRAPESSSYGDVMPQHGQNLQPGQTNQRTMHNPLQGPNLPPGASQDLPISYADNLNHSARVISQEGQLSPYSAVNKRPQNQQVGSYVDKFQGSDLQWRNQMLHPNANGQYGNPGLKKYPQLVGEVGTTMDGVKVEKTEPIMMESEGDYMDPRVHQRFQNPNPLMRLAFQQTGWNNQEPRKEDQLSKRKSSQSPRLPAGVVSQSPFSGRSVESMGPHYGAVSSGGPLGQKSGPGSVSANNQQTQQGLKRRSTSLPKTPGMNGVGSPASVNTMSGGPMNVSSPSISIPQLTEQDMLERFAKIEMVSMRHQLNRKKNKVEEYPRNSRGFSAQQLLERLANVANNEYVDDSREMSKSLVGGHMNICKIRVINVRPGMQGNIPPVPAGTRMIFSEKPNDGTVAMHYGDLNDGAYLEAEDHLPTLPNTHWADLLADQFCTLVIREGYVVDEVVQPRPPRSTGPSNGQPNNNNNPAVDTQQHSDSFPGQAIESKPAISNTSLNSNPNIPPNSVMHPPGNQMAMPARQQQMDPHHTNQQQQPPQHHQQSPLQNQSSLMPPQHFQRSPMMLPNNSMPPQMNAYGQNSNITLGNNNNNNNSNHMDNKSNIQMLRQQQPQPSNIQRGMMMGLGTAMGMGQMGNNMGLGGLSSVMGIRGVGTTGMSTGVGVVAGIGNNLVQNLGGLSPANAISQHLRAGTLNPQALAAHRIKMMGRGGMPGVPQGGMGRQMQAGPTGLSMLGQTINRGNMGQMQRGSAMGQMGQMGMPNLMQNMNIPLNQQQIQQLNQMRLQQHQQQQQQQQNQQQLPRQQVLPQQEATSPLQGVLLPQQVGSPSTMGIPQQMNQQQQASPQQMNQRAPMSPPLNSGPIHPVSTGNLDGCPASPALSSQTLGSVGSITNSPMDLQGVNKSNSVTNT